ncbi:MAG: hypothetical protein QOH97_779 [Actinoplanes sp.]|nr:hypothetical protein [Actinoplanes sp.]
MTQIAIVGMAALFPGSADLDQYWSNLKAGRGFVRDVPADRFDDVFYDPAQSDRPDRFYCRRGGFVEDAAFEPLRFGIMPNAVAGIEPDQLIALQVAAAAIEDAGGAGKMPDADRIGVILGRGGSLSPGANRHVQRVRMPTQVTSLLQEMLPELDEARLEQIRHRLDACFQGSDNAIDLVPNLAASRVANRLNLRGPAYTVDAACASSLIAVDQATNELSLGRLDAVLAGGTHHVHDINFWSVFNQLRALSSSGEIRPFAAAADGVLIGEGTGFVVLKRLADAERDGDRIYATIRGCGTSSDGRSASMFNPVSSGQAIAIQRAWEIAGLDPTAPDALGLLEGHGTGTPIGDATELTTVAEVFGPHTGGERPVIGSVKSMIGHTMPAAGIAGLIKAVLAVYHGVLPPTLNCTEPRAEMAQTRFAPIAEAKPWRSARPRRAAVNAFGFGGINAHVIVEQHVTAAASVAEPDQVVWLAADSPAALARLLDQPDALVREFDRVGETVGGPARIGVVDPTDQRLAVARRMVARGTAWRGGRDIWYTPRPLLGPGGGKLAFVFPGVEAEFAPRTADVAAHFGLPYRDLVADDLGRHGLGLIEAGVLLDTALRRLNVRPDALAGHSIGEWTAGTVSGQTRAEGVNAFLSAFDATKVEVHGYVFAAINAPAQTIAPALTDYPGVLLTHDNSPVQCMVNGPREQVQLLVDSLLSRNVLCRVLPFRSVFHTPLFAEGMQAIGAAVGRWGVGPTEVPVWSGNTAAPFPADPQEVAQLILRHMVEPVRFRQLMNAMYEAGFRVFLQVGAGQLATVIDDNLRDREHLAVPVNVSRRSGMDQLRRVATALWVDGASPDWRALEPVPVRERKTPSRQVAVPAERRGPSVRLDLGGPLVKLGAGAAGLLGATVREPAPAAAASRPAGPAAAVALPETALSVLAGMGGTSHAARELAALLQETADSAVAVLQAAPAAMTRPAAPVLPRVPGLRADVLPGVPGLRADVLPGVPGQPSDVLLRTSLRVSVEDLPYLLDHCFFAQPPAWPTVADRWPVMPATTIVWHMMKAAEQAAPGMTAIGVRDARFNRWVLAAPATQVDITVTRSGGNDVTVAFGMYARATVELGTRYPQPPEPAWPTPAGREFPTTIGPAEMYEKRYMFHGPQFQGVTAVHALGEMHVRGTVTVSTAPGALLDNALQIIGTWIATTQDSPAAPLPVGLSRIRFYGPPPEPDTELDCQARITSITDRELVRDTQLSAGGRVWAQIDGAADRRFEGHPTIHPFAGYPDRAPMATVQPEGWTMVFDAWNDAVTRTMTAHRILGTQAAARYERMPPAQRRTWLMGRIAAIDAVRLRQWKAGVSSVYPIEVSIQNESSGRPVIEPRPGHLESVVSLAHTAEIGVAIAGPAGAAVGIDVAEVVPRDDATIRFALVEREIAQLGEHRDLDFARLWAAKEAVGKALGTGLDGAPRRFVVSLADSTVMVDGRCFTVGWRELTNPPELPARHYVVAWTRPPEEKP